VASPERVRDRTWIVALAAAMWGLDNWLRGPLAKPSAGLSAATIVFWEHLIALVAVSAFVPRAVRVFRRCSRRDQAAIAVIGIGCSAVATALFTEAFSISARSNDFITPLVLQKLQPLFAVTLAVLVLRERLRASFGVYAVPALIGAWLLSFATPFHVQVAAAKVALLATAAALLWAGGTVLGRLVSPAVGPRDLMVLRYVWGTPAALVVLLWTHADLTPGWGHIPRLILLALIPGVLALALYYYGLRATAASRATFAEMAFPVTAAFVGVVFLNSSLRWSQWLGFAIVVAAITALGWHERRRKPAVIAPPVDEAVAVS
jgi:drug/metabolite transporter (DMT)-like permease